MVRKEVESRLASFAASRQIPVAYEGATFTPPADSVWLEIYFLEPERFHRELSATRVTEYGSFRINVHGKLGIGVGAVTQLARDVATLFPVIPKVGVTSIESPPNIGRVIPDTNSVFVPVTVRYRAEFQ